MEVEEVATASRAPMRREFTAVGVGAVVGPIPGGRW
jgi:hypothetical protein